FMAKLDNAIAGQHDVVKMAQRKIEQERAAWQEAERKRLSYEALEKRNVQTLLKKEAKRDQRAMDEHATRQFFYKR
ncbi:MAG: flagellar FliJ family protein, partial [Burkholderiales bacterium]|nr:flagellar FliJ family protein [Burkholderiales bacterium]